MDELSSGIYNTLKSGTSVQCGITAKDFFQGVETANHQVEANLITMFQPVRGRQYWYLRRSEVLCAFGLVAYSGIQQVILSGIITMLTYHWCIFDP